MLMLNSIEHEMSTANKTKIPTNAEVLTLSLSDVEFIMLIMLKCQQLLAS